MRWSLGGVDAEDFTIEDGVLRFAKTPDYESAKRRTISEPPFTNTYVVDVQATDETRRTGDGDGHGQCDQRGRGWDGGAVGPAAAVGHRLHRHPRRIPDGASLQRQVAVVQVPVPRAALTAPSTRPRPATYMPLDDGISITTCGPRSPTLTRRVKTRRRRWSPPSRCRGSGAPTWPPSSPPTRDPNMLMNQDDGSAVCGGEHRSRLDRGRPGDGGPQGRRCADLHAVGCRVALPRLGDSANFDIDGATGQIMTKVKSALDAEGDGTGADDDENAYVEYTVVVRATDPAGIPGASDRRTREQRRSHGGYQSHRRERCAGGGC